MKLYGRNPVIERLKSNPQSIRLIYLEDDLSDSSYIRKKARERNISVLTVPRSKMLKLARSLNAQGVLAEVEDFNYHDFDDLTTMALQNNYTLLFLDSLNDPQNLGSILRSAACLGKFAVVLPTHDSVEITEATLRVACGGDNFVPVAKVANLSQAIMKTKKAGFWIAGAVVQGGKKLNEVDLPFPLALVVGSEHKGIRDIIRKQLDLEIKIPMAHERLSLNAAQATTIFCYEIAKQKKDKKPG